MNAVPAINYPHPTDADLLAFAQHLQAVARTGTSPLEYASALGSLRALVPQMVRLIQSRIDFDARLRHEMRDEPRERYSNIDRDAGLRRYGEI